MARLPDFLVIGGMRCGSTTLHNILSAHPKIGLPETKELHFFDRRNPDIGDSVDRYQAQFDSCAEMDLCGEVTPDYLTTPQCDQRIAELLPNARLVVILREPVARLCSHYLMSVANGAEPLVLSEALAAESERLQQRNDTADIFHSYQERSDYLPHLKRFAQRFGRDNIHVLFLEELNSDPQTVLTDLLSFLQLEPQTNKTMLDAVTVTNRNADIFRLKLNRWQRWIQVLSDRFGLRTAEQSSERPTITEQQKRQLAEQFQTANAELSQWLGRELPW